MADLIFLDVTKLKRMKVLITKSYRHVCRNGGQGNWRVIGVQFEDKCRNLQDEEEMKVISMQRYQIYKIVLLIEGSQASPICPSGNSDVSMNA